MARQDTPTAPPEDPTAELLDLRQVAQLTQPVLTSAGNLQLRRMAALSPLERAQLAVLQARLRRTGEAIDAAPDDAGEEELVALAEAHRVAEDELLRAMLVGVTDQQLEDLPVPERVGLLTAFFGASPTEAQRAVAAAVRALEGIRPRGGKRSRASSGSTGATRRAG